MSDWIEQIKKAEMEHEKLKPLFDELHHGNTQKQHEAKKRLAELGQEIIDPLVIEFKQLSRTTERIVELLAATGDKRNRKVLLNALRHFDLDVREAAAKGLGKIGNGEVAWEILAAYHPDVAPSPYWDEHRMTWDTFFKAVCEIGTPSLVPILLEIQTRRERDLLGLTLMQMPFTWDMCVKVIIQLMRVRSKDIMDYLFRVEHPAIYIDWEEKRDAALLYDDFHGRLLELLQSDDSYLRQSAVLAISLAGFTDDIDRLIDLFNQEKVPSVLHMIVQALGRLQAQRDAEMGTSILDSSANPPYFPVGGWGIVDEKSTYTDEEVEAAKKRYTYWKPRHDLPPTESNQ